VAHSDAVTVDATLHGRIRCCFGYVIGYIVFFYIFFTVADAWFITAFLLLDGMAMSTVRRSKITVTQEHTLIIVSVTDSQ
jgi:uncharacterized membrane protein